MGRLNIRVMRANLSDTVNRTYYQGERILLVRRGKAVAALVPVEDLKAIEALEDKADIRAVNKVRADLKEGRDKLIPWEEARKRLEQHKVPRRRAGRKAG